MVADEMLDNTHEHFRPLFGTRLRAPQARSGARFVPCLPRQDCRREAVVRLSATDADPDEAAMREPASDALADARAQAEALIAEARVRAQALLAEAEADCSRFAAETRATTAATVRAEQERAFAREIEDFRARFRQAQETALAMIAQDVMSIVADIAEKVIFETVATDPEATLRAVREALRQAPGSGRVRLLVPEEDANAVSEVRAALLAVLHQDSELEILPDSAVSRGGCIVQAERGVVDARLETRIARVREEIADEV